MGRQLTESELKRFNRVIAGHSQDKDRARRKRKLAGEGVSPKPARTRRKAEKAPVLDDPQQSDED